MRAVSSKSGVPVILATLLTFFLLTTSASAQVQLCTDEVPVLTGPTSAVTTSGEFPGGAYPGWQAFDNSTGSMWISDTFPAEASISYDFGQPVTINSYTILNSNGTLTSRAPKDWELLGWLNGFWVLIDDQRGETNWVSGQPRTYYLSNPVSYSRYRLRITDDNDSRSGIVVISIGNLEFGTCSTCGDGLCQTNENCGTCAFDCGFCSSCGNGICEPGEDCDSCPQDCGSNPVFCQ